jgi:3-oxoacyl-[acyl-carrier-protein] synthase II
MAYRSDTFTPRPQQRTVITGAGILTAHGSGWQVNADAFRNGTVSLRPVTLFDVSRQRVHTAGEVILPDKLPSHHLSPRELPRLERGAHLLIHAAHEALAAANHGARHALSLTNLPAVLGTSAGGMALGEAFFRQAQSASPQDTRRQASRAIYYQAQQQAAIMQRALGLTGPTSVISNACASGANAIAHAFSLVRRGDAPAVLCGGYDALCQLVFAGFDSLKALSPTAARPFDAARDGLALGEGAGLLLVENRDHALARGAPILAEIAGSGAGTDLHHLTQPHPQGDAALASMTAACAMAGLHPCEIDYLNSHGTGTPLNDIAEALAIQRWAGDSTGRLPVSSTKGGIGHLLGGAGAVEAIVCLMALRGGFLPPCVNIETPDPACTFDLIRQPRPASLRTALTNSFGFGGSNATLIFRQPD